ncbi:MAG: hypothetical protein GY803_32570 [Chloroflexi bacterium]|nr:hypothetical protein [Chloroflexota bacterium]
MNTQKQKTQRSIVSVAMIAFAALYLFIEQYQPTISSWLPLTMIIVGIPLVVLGAIFYGRFHHVFDHEPVEFLGQKTSGKSIRSLLFNIGLIGGWLIVLGTLFSLLGRPSGG